VHDNNFHGWYSFPENALYGLSKPDSQTGSFIALYEYLGTYDLPSTDKVRTNPKVIQQIKEDHRKPKEIFLQMNLNNSVKAPKDTRQINQRLSRPCIVHHGLVLLSGKCTVWLVQARFTNGFIFQSHFSCGNY
jgi:hypothetical protein